MWPYWCLYIVLFIGLVDAPSAPSLAAIGKWDGLYQFGTPFPYPPETLEEWSPEHFPKDQYLLYSEGIIDCKQSCHWAIMDPKGVNLEAERNYARPPLDIVFLGFRLVGEKSYISHIHGVVSLFDLADPSKIVPFGKLETPDRVYELSWQNEGYLIPIYISGLVFKGFAYNPAYFHPYNEDKIMETIMNVDFQQIAEYEPIAEKLVFYNLKTFADEWETLEQQFKKQNDVLSKQDAPETPTSDEAFGKSEL